MADGEKKEWLGISYNRGSFQGIVTEDPTIVPNGDVENAYIYLKTVFRAMDANGQFTDQEQIIPLLVMDGNKVEKLVKPLIQKGRKMHVDAYYKSWNDGNGGIAHAFIVTNCFLGDKPYVPKDQEAGGPGLPPR